MTAKAIVCPKCGSEEHVYKVSQLYLESLMHLKHKDAAETPVIDKLKAEAPEERLKKESDEDYYRNVVQAFKPPEGGAQGTRTINPDWVAVALAFISVYFLNQIYNNNHEVFWYMVLMVVVGYGLYFVFRKQIMGRYEAIKSKEMGSKDLVEKAIGVWMKLYYCSADNAVFDVKKGEAIPLAELNGYLAMRSNEK